MTLHRTTLALLLSLITAFAPFASVAMAKPCMMSAEMSTSSPAHCLCDRFMPGCGTMPQCRTAVGCVNHCFLNSAVLPNGAGAPAVSRPAEPARYGIDLHSLLIRPPTPPPRA